MLPVRDPNELFSDTHFQDSILQHTKKSECWFLDKAIEYAEISINAIMDDTSPLPKTSNQSEHYEAITGANGFISNLLGLWIELNEPEE